MSNKWVQADRLYLDSHQCASNSRTCWPILGTGVLGPMEGSFLSIKVIFPVCRLSGTYPSCKISFISSVNLLMYLLLALLTISVKIPSTPGALSDFNSFVILLMSSCDTGPHTCASYSHSGRSIGIHWSKSVSSVILTSLSSCCPLCVKIGLRCPRKLLASCVKAWSSIRLISVISWPSASSTAVSWFLFSAVLLAKLQNRL